MVLMAIVGGAEEGCSSCRGGGYASWGGEEWIAATLGGSANGSVTSNLTDPEAGDGLVVDGSVAETFPSFITATELRERLGTEPLERLVHRRIDLASLKGVHPCRWLPQVRG